MYDKHGYVCVTDPKWFVDFDDGPVMRASVEDMVSGTVTPRFDAPKEVHNAFIRIVTNNASSDNFIIFRRGDDVFACWVTPGMTLGSLALLFAATFVVAAAVVWFIWG